MIDNKYLRSVYNRLSQIFGDKKSHVDLHEEAESKLEDKLPILNREARAITSLIDCNNKLIECIEAILKGHEYNIEYFKMLRDVLQLRKENVKLELEYYGKMDFVDQYENIIKLSKETAAAELKQANENINNVIKELQEMLPSIPEGSKEKLLTISMLHEHFSSNKKLTSRQFTEFYKRLIDMSFRNRQYIDKKEWDETHITI